MLSMTVESSPLIHSHHHLLVRFWISRHYSSRFIQVARARAGRSRNDMSVDGAVGSVHIQSAMLSVAYALAISGIFVGISAMTASRSRAMFAVLVVYFVLVVFWAGFLPFLTLEAVIDTVASTLGVTVSQPTRDIIRGLSPTNAYFQITAEVYTGEYEAFS